MKAAFWVFAVFLTLARLGSYLLGTDKATPVRPRTFVATPAPLANADVKLEPPSVASVIAPGVVRRRTMVPSAGGPIRLWIYTPEKPTGKKLPCVFVAPAGTPLIWGMDLGSGDMPEHLPYVKAGFAVIAYEIAGAVASPRTSAPPAASVKAFLAANGGVENARSAMDYAEKFLPELDRTRFFVAGHSSAATLALQVAQHEPRVRACAAYAPVTDLEGRVGPDIRLLDLLGGFSQYVRDYSPLVQAQRLGVPALIFHAKDDSNVRCADSQRFVELVQRTNPKVSLKLAESGGHYDAMISEGIPAGIAFFRQF